MAESPCCCVQNKLRLTTAIAIKLGAEGAQLIDDAIVV